MWENKRFHSLNHALKKQFGEKIYKVSLDGGFTCPNRDGSIDRKGCIFCSDSGSGEYAGNRRKSITQQIEDQLELISRKFPDGKVIAYFQNFTNTYGDTDYLRKIYEEALAHPRVVGLAIATRPDSISEDALDLLTELNEKTFLWIEMGLQTVRDDTAELINRGYPLAVFTEMNEKLYERGIRVVVHLIAGLPGEGSEDFIEDIRYINKARIWGVKIHLLHVIKNTRLARLYAEGGFRLLEEEEYIDLVCDSLKELNGDVVVHRLTGDGSKDTLVGPLWSLNKRRVLNEIDKRLKTHNIVQGCCEK